MVSINTNSTLYDLLSAIIPGFLILLWIREAFPCFTVFSLLFYGNIISSVILFSLSYILGLIIKFLTELLTKSKFRTNTKWIYSMLLKAEIRSDFKDRIINYWGENDENEKRFLYYEKYYEALKARVNTPIPTLESQVAFLRSMIFVTIPFVFSTACISSYLLLQSCCLFIILVLLEIAMFFIFVHVQKCIYKIVWEDAYFYELNNDKFHKENTGHGE